MSRNELLDAWVTAEAEALRAELELRKLGQAAPDPAVGELAKRCAELRAEADRLFRLLPKDT